MKRFKIGFLALVAIVAMSFTIVAHTSLKGTKKATTDCFRPKSTGSIDIILKASNCPTATNTISSSTSCFSPASQKIWDLDETNFFTSAQVPTSCPGSTTFCCLTVVEDANPCTNQDQFDIGAGLKYYKVDQVFCKD